MTDSSSDAPLVYKPVLRVPSKIGVFTKDPGGPRGIGSLEWRGARALEPHSTPGP